MTGTRGGGGPRVVFVLSMFPCHDETFLLREIHAVSQRLESWVFSLRRSRDRVVHDEAAALRARLESVICRRRSSSPSASNAVWSTPWDPTAKPSPARPRTWAQER